jgi:hypothetical protein
MLLLEAHVLMAISKQALVWMVWAPYVTSDAHGWKRQ